jgi:DNA-binding transcriptional ArsR family regulator
VEAGSEGLPAGDIARELDLPAATLSFHLKELVASGLAGGARDGRSIFYSANFERMRELLGYLSANCCRRATRQRSC